MERKSSLAKQGRLGLLLINLGTPEGTSYWPMRRYLGEFLSDRRVIELNPVLWWFILNGIILTTRPKRSGRAYEKIWNRERNESPLKTITRSQAEKVAADLTNVTVDWAMRYGLPPIAERLDALKKQGCERILLFPLYPQYSASTTASVLDRCYDVLQRMRWQPAIRTVPPYFDHPAYIDAITRSFEAKLASLPWQPDVILASFHGLPESYVAAGDPYRTHCEETVKLLRVRLKMGEDRLVLVFQSRFGKAEWLKPYAVDTVAAAPAKGVKNLVMIMPGFAADCVETLEEVAIGLGETFHASGGENFASVPCLNDSNESVAMLAAIAREELQGWL
jgi:ferrochelatase